MVPPFSRYAVMPVARNVWQLVLSGSRAARVSALDHAEDVVAGDPLLRELPLAIQGPEERLLLLAGDPCSLDIGVEVGLGVVVGRHLVKPPALLVELQA